MRLLSLLSISPLLYTNVYTSDRFTEGGRDGVTFSGEGFRDLTANPEAAASCKSDVAIVAV